MATAGSKVTVACKIGVPWFALQLCEKREVMENTQTGPRKVTEYARTGNIVHIRGTSYPRGTPPVGFPEKPQIINGYALTKNVDKDFWDKWYEQNKKAPYVVSGMIMAHETIDAVRGSTSDHNGHMSGLEPMRPDNDPRVPRPTNSAITGIETEDSRKGRIAAAAEMA